MSVQNAWFGKSRLVGTGWAIAVLLGASYAHADDGGAKTRNPAAPAEAPVAAPAVATGDVFITSAPSGASVYLDGVATGSMTPFVIRGVALGSHTAEARTACARASSQVSVTNGTIVRADLALLEQPGALVISSVAPDTRVFVDGADVGKAPITLPDVTCGAHSVMFRAPNHLEAKATIQVAGYETLSIVVVDTAPTNPAPSQTPGTVQVLLPKEEFGTLVLDVTPLEAQLRVDGFDVGTGPRSLDRIATGVHSVSGSLEGYSPMTVDVRVTADAIARTTLTLQRPIPLTPVEPLPKSKAEKRRSTGPNNAGRILLNAGVSALGIGAGVYSYDRFSAAKEAYGWFQTVPSEVAAQQLYTEDVVPNRVRGWVSAGASALGVVGATALWITTDF